jgi:uncharacterized protein YbjT (DUF2867 family)
LCLVVRKRLEEWKDEDFKCKLKVVQMDNFDDMSSLKEEIQGYDAMLCTLGTRVKVGKELFKKVDYEYPINFARTGLECGVHYYGLLTSMGADPKSWFFYMKTKGEVERDIKKIGIPHLALYKPGLLLNRDNDSRIGEKIGSVIPFISKIESSDVGICMLDHAIKSSQNRVSQATEVAFNNSDLVAQAT